jgi:quinol-cytochrome oxidoreductase complex cytochrome b subunit
MDRLNTFLGNLKTVPFDFWNSFFRHGAPTTDRTRSETIFHNVFLHIHPTRVHRWSLKPTLSLGLGVMTTAAYVILAITGILLMLYYKPSTILAYDSIKDIHFVVPSGRIIRNLHRWGAHLMVITAILHMARVFFTSSYKSSRQFNWVVGLALLVLTLMLSFTGYLLPWDQVAYWAITICANIAQSPREITDALHITQFFDPGGLTKTMLLGGNEVGEEALIRFNMLHCILLPIALSMVLCLHFWRIRKDGGLARPDDADQELGPPSEEETPVFTQAPQKTYGLMAFVRGSSPRVGKGPENTLPAWPHLFYAELAVFMVTVVITLAISLFFDAPLKELANPLVPENPAKAPWYFLGLQELVSYSAFMGGIGIPMIALLGLFLIPYLDKEKTAEGRWFAREGEKEVTLKSAMFGLTSVILLEAFAITCGWIRNWLPGTPQLIITLINPGSVLTFAYMLWSILIFRRTGSMRLGAVALFTCFLAGFLVLTVVAVQFRGPNWDFYWWPSLWPTH